ncbi:hypothetical protein TRIUR3_23806 [Triticum urartu]|uniref:Uncharacterized protein n=1 Tax=Triticum urartu TaxID=4572 RepID=M7ZXJ8_TRIUA|nr:hypothetical protein TRIUR3_23806 [Triticum urartu]
MPKDLLTALVFLFSIILSVTISVAMMKQKNSRKLCRLYSTGADHIVPGRTRINIGRLFGT